MEAILLAAGKGSRLGKYTKDNTKCMLKVNGVTLLERTIESLVESNVKKLTIVLGYKGENVKKYIDEMELNKKIEIKYMDNSEYENSNNIYSLYLTKNIINDDVILLESDIIFEKDIIIELVNSTEKNMAVVDKYQDWMDGTVVKFDEYKNITSFIGKDKFNYKDKDEYYKTVNIYKFSKHFFNEVYMPFLEQYINVYGKNDYYETVLRITTIFKDSELKAYNVNNKRWYEIDNEEDFKNASKIFKKK